jgi:ketosteroid isomerase-like protein
MAEKPATPDRAELVRQAFDAANRGDFDALMGFFAPDALLDGIGTFEGISAFKGLTDSE